VTGVWPVEQVRAAEDALMATLPAGALMQRAAYGLAVHCGRLLPRRYGARVALLVGAGNNGGDALYAGATLARRGAQVTAVLLSPDRAHPGGLAALRAARGRAVGADQGGGAVRGADAVLDGVVGIGGRGGLRPAAAALAGVARESGAVRVAVDVPSGVDSDTGDVPGAVFDADVTVTFGCLKPGLLVGAGAVAAGRVEQVDIGLLPYLPPPRLQVLEAADVALTVPRPGPEDDKYARGVVGVAAGSKQYTGAAVLATAAAAHGPAGMVRYAGGAADLIRAWLPEVIASDGPPSQAGRVQAWVVGPGIGTDDAGEAMLEVARAVPDLNNPPIEWRLGDAEALPSTDATFDLVLCNEGLQFFAQPMRALEEMRRVLRPNGRLALAIWRPIQHQQGLERLVDVLEQHLTPHAADLRGMSGRWERTDLRNLVASVGFADVHIRIDPGSVRWPSVDACLSTTLGGSPLASAFDDLSTEARVALVRQLEKQAGDDYIDDDGVIVPFEAYVLSARR